MEERLIEFIKSEFITEEDIQITAETKLISGGIIDSFSLFSLQAYIEREFGKNSSANDYSRIIRFGKTND